MTEATIDGRMHDGELLERFPEIEYIEDDELRTETKSALARGIPDYFWNVPATSSGYYHNTYGKGKHGLWIHVKMVFSAYQRVVDSFVELGWITEYEADCGRAAVLLHDMLKYGHSYSEGDSTVTNHDRLAGMWVQNNTDLPKPVVDAVKSHNGSWYDGPSPEPDDFVSILVHVADMSASTKNGTWGVLEPHDDIHERYPDIPRCDY